MEKEKCVVCKKPTEYDTHTPVDLRSNYVEGCGQLCTECYNRVYFTEQKNNKKKTYLFND